MIYAVLIYLSSYLVRLRCKHHHIGLRSADILFYIANDKLCAIHIFYFLSCPSRLWTYLYIAKTNYAVFMFYFFSFCLSSLWIYFYIATTNYTEFTCFTFCLVVCLSCDTVFTSPRRTMQSLHISHFVFLSVSAVNIILLRHVEPCKVDIFYVLSQLWIYLYIATTNYAEFTCFTFGLVVCLRYGYISLHRHDEPYRIYMFYFLPRRTIQSLHVLLLVLSALAVNLFSYRHDELCSVVIFYFLSCCLSQLWICFYIATTNYAELTCFTFGLVVCLRYGYIFASTRRTIFYFLSCCLSQLWICFYIAMTNYTGLTCFTFCLLVCSSCEYNFTSPR